MRHINMIPDDLLKAVSVPFSSLGSQEGNEHMSLRQVMDEYGFAVVTDVLTSDEVQRAEALFDMDLDSIVKLTDEQKLQVPFMSKQKADTSKSLAKRWPLEMYPLGRNVPGFASDFGLPHGRCAWHVRTHKNVHSVFEHLFDGCKELCVGADNVFFNNEREDRTTPDEELTNGLWPHADQSVHIAGGEYDCYQGILYLWPSSSYTSTTVVWPRSHRDVYNTLMQQRAFASHFCKLQPTRYGEFSENAVRVTVPSGGMILWSSKTIHQGWNHGPRLAVPVCMEPTKRRSDEALKRKTEACFKGLPTTHWASLGIVHGVADMSDGGTKKVPLTVAAHKWLVQPDGSLDPQVQDLL